MSGLVSMIELQTLIHSTEDPSKVRTALLNVVCPSDRESIHISSDRMVGYYKNPIRLLKVRIRDRQILKRTIEHLSSKLQAIEKERIASRLDLMSDRSKFLYLRLDKQMAYEENLRLGRHDPIRVRIKFSPRWVRSKSISSLCKEIGIVP